MGASVGAEAWQNKAIAMEDRGDGAAPTAVLPGLELQRMPACSDGNLPTTDVPGRVDQPTKDPHRGST
jgi:hypothetical protein